MRHGNRNNSLSRTSSHRNAMLSNMACSLIEHKRMTTTVAKAKVLRKFVEPLITKSKTDATDSRRLVFGDLKSKDRVAELFRDVAPKVANRDGGYTRIIKLGTRKGDASEMCLIELVDFIEIMLEECKTKTRRSRRGGKKSATGSKPAAETTAKAEKATAETSPEDTTTEATTTEDTAEKPIAEAKSAEKSEAKSEEKVDDKTDESSEKDINDEKKD